MSLAATFAGHKCPQVSEASVLRIFAATQETRPPLLIRLLLRIPESHFRKKEETSAYLCSLSTRLRARYFPSRPLKAPLSLLLHPCRPPLADCQVSLMRPLRHLQWLASQQSSAPWMEALCCARPTSLFAPCRTSTCMTHPSAHVGTPGGLGQNF
jgi:hypothetical protein